MANWNVESSKSSWATNSIVNNFKSQRASTRSAGIGSDMWSQIVKGVSSIFNGGGYSVVGINATKVEEMRNAIREYVRAIQAHLDGIDPTTNANGAFKGEEIQNAVRSYVERLKQYSKDLTSQLLAFSDKLKDVADAWEAYNKSMAENVTSTSSSFGNNGAYTEQK